MNAVSAMLEVDHHHHHRYLLTTANASANNSSITITITNTSTILDANGNDDINYVEYYDPDDISSLSDTQEKILSLLPILPATLSIMGSTQIIYMIWIARNKKWSPYRRILLGLSCCDIFSSIIYVLQAFLVPQHIYQRIWAIGNDTTCSFLGFATQLSFSQTWYNGMLSLFFLFTVKFGIRDEILTRKYEPWMHSFAIGYPLMTAIVGTILGKCNLEGTRKKEIITASSRRRLYPS